MELKEQDPDYIAVSDEDIKLLEKVVKDVNKKSTRHED